MREEGGFLRIGGRTREAVLERSEVVKARYPILIDTARVIADPLVRNRATVGRQPGAWRPGERSPSDHARLARVGRGAGPKRRAR